MRIGRRRFDGRVDHIDTGSLGNAVELIAKRAIVVTNDKT